MIVGSIGEVVFETSRFLILTWQEVRRQGFANFADHAVIGQKAVSEFTGLGLDELEFDITLNVMTGINPVAELKRLKEMKDSGKPYQVIIGNEVYGWWTIRLLEDDFSKTILNQPAVINVKLMLTEYIGTLPSEAEMKMREEELRREDTGLGGPQRLAGSPPPTQEVQLQPRIDPVTRMVIND